MSLIIADAEFERGITRINDITDELLSIFSSYADAVQVLADRGICDEKVNNVLSKKVWDLQIYANNLLSINQSIIGYTQNFLTDIDEADSYLYD